MRRTLAFRIAFTIGYCCKISITLKTLSMSEMAFHENAGPGQVDFDLSFLKSPFPSWREGVQSGPERSRARSLRRSEPLTARTDLLPFRQEGKGPSLRDSCSFLFFPFLHAPTNPVATLPSALLVSDFCFARCKLGVLVSAGAAT